MSKEYNKSSATIVNKLNDIVVDKENIDYAGMDIDAAMEDIRKALREGKISEAGLRRVGALNDIDVETMIEFSKKSRLELQQDPYYKTDLSNSGTTTMLNIDGHLKHMYPMKKGDVVEQAGVKLTRSGDHTIECESDYLGNFKYDDRDYEVKFIELNEDDGSTSYLPVLKYVGELEKGFKLENAVENVFLLGDIVDGARYLMSGGDDNYNVGKDTIDIPDGVKSLDYTFEGLTDLEHFPTNIPSSVTSMHCTFEGCKNMTIDQEWFDRRYAFLPDGLVDMSYTFKGCEKLRGIFAETPDSDSTFKQRVSYGYARSTENDNTQVLLNASPIFGTGIAGCASSALSLVFSDDASWHVPNGVVNLTECWNGCESMDDVSELFKYKYPLPQYGGDITPYLSAALAKDCLANISGNGDDEYVKQYADNIEFMVDYSGQVTEKFLKDAKKLDQDKLNKTKTTATIVDQGSSHLGKVMSRPELASGGARSDNKVDLDGTGKFVYDTTGLKNSLQTNPDGNLWEKLALYGATFAGSAALTSHFSKNKYVLAAGGLGGTIVMGTVFPQLYRSMYPVLNFTRNLLPEGDFKDKYSEWINEHCSVAENIDHNKELEEKNKMWDDEYNVASAYISGVDANGNVPSYSSGEARESMTSPLTDIFARASRMAVMWEESELDTLMKNSSESCADTETFLALGTYRDPKTGTFKDCTAPVDEALDETTHVMEEYWLQSHNDGTYDDETICQDIKSYYSTLLHAIDVYSQSGVSAIDSKYGTTTKEARLAKEGLAMVNDAYVKSVTESMDKIDAEFHFMDDEMRNKMKSVSLQGVSFDGNKFEKTVSNAYTDDRQQFWDERDEKTSGEKDEDDKTLEDSPATMDKAAEAAASFSFDQADSQSSVDTDGLTA